ncbi:hypothetical protein PG993_007556 [Apiospora rasikravindrae]|uniref:Uncharacterized protein n=1 Tax=Apiospora rasikravindrae TaxID=990691 RepID=A0ABR1SXU2_9PEZI
MFTLLAYPCQAESIVRYGRLGLAYIVCIMHGLGVMSLLMRKSSNMVLVVDEAVGVISYFDV